MKYGRKVFRTVSRQNQSLEQELRIYLNQLIINLDRTLRRQGDGLLVFLNVYSVTVFPVIDVRIFSPILVASFTFAALVHVLH